jgi:hypothetical protein
MPTIKNKIRKGGGPNNSQAYTNFLGTFGATKNMSSEDIQKLYKTQLEKDFQASSTNTPITPTTTEAIKTNLSNYIQYIINLYQDTQVARQTINNNRNALMKQQSLEKQYRDLLKRTNVIGNSFDKYLLQYMSFIMINPKRTTLLNDLTSKMESIIEKYKLSDPVSGNTYTANVQTKVNQDQNNIMIAIIQAIIENTQPIYLALKTSSSKLYTNVANNSTRKILEDLNQSRQTNSKIQKEFNNNISNWIQLLTDIIQLNATYLVYPEVNSQLAADRIAEFYLDYQTSRKNIDNMLSGSNQNSIVNNLSKNKSTNEVFVQQLVSEVFKWGLATFKIYKHTQIVGPLPTKISTESKN